MGMNSVLSENQKPIPVVDEVEDIDNLSDSNTNDHQSEQGTPNGKD